MPTTLSIRLLGRFVVERDGQAIPTTDWRGQKPRDLLKILLLAKGRYVAKEQLYEWLWPGSEPESAQAKLRSVVSDLRKALEPGLARGRESTFITTEHEGYAFNAEAPVMLDIARFEQVGANAQASRGELEIGLTLYRGDLLEEDPYAEWALRERERLREVRLGLLNRLSEACLQERQYDQSIAVCEQALAIDPAQETIWRTLMQAHAANGDRAAAVNAFDRCRAALSRELGVDPSPETTTLHTQLLQNGVPASNSTISIAASRNPEKPRWLYRIGSVGLALWAILSSINVALALAGILRGSFVSPGDPGNIALPYLLTHPVALADLNSQIYFFFPIGWLLLIGYIGWAAALRTGSRASGLVWVGLAAGIADGVMQTLTQAINLTQLSVLPAAYINALPAQQLSLITVWDVLRQLASICGMLSLIANPIALTALAWAMRGQGLFGRWLAWLGVGIVAATMTYYLVPVGLPLALPIGIALAFGLQVWLLAVAVWLWLHQK